VLIPLLIATALGDTGQTAPPPHQADLDAGRAFLVDKLVDPAINSFSACLEIDPDQVDCHWEKGWAHYLGGEWTEVVSHWERVMVQDPERVGDHLQQARDQLALRALTLRGRADAPASFASDVPQGTTLRLRAVGDMMIGTDFPAGYLPADDGADMFTAVTPWLADADLTFGNLEGPLCDSGKTNKCRPDSAPGSCYAFRTPGRYAPLFKAAGFDLLSTANNHASDFGEVCRHETEALLDGLGIAHSGRPGDIASVQANGLKIAMIGFHTSRSCHYLNDHETAAQLVRALATEHDIVIASFHGGREGSKALHTPNGRETFYGEDRGHLRRFARDVIDAGADLVLGHGPHVLRGMEVYNERLIAYSLGNFATYGRFNIRGPNGLGVILETELSADGRFIGGKLLATRQAGRGIPEPDESAEAVDLIRRLSMEDFGASGVLVAQDGTLASP
jgi:hypothetical protein